jgi:hypothetical protein
MGEGERLAQALEALKATHFDAAGSAGDYAALARSRERAELAAALSALEGVDPKRLSIPWQTAFWLNAYNAGVLRDHAEIGGGGFFARQRLRIAGHAWALDDIEHGLLRGNVAKPGSLMAPMKKSDPRLAFVPPAYEERVHFALHCGSRSSPPLRVFRGTTLEADLDGAVRDYLSATVRVEDEEFRVKLRLPKILDWYAGDFGGRSGVLRFVLGRLDDEVADLVDRRAGRVKVKFFDFDWTLNQRRG